MKVKGKIVVLDIGKSNIKLSVCSYLCEIFETLMIPNFTCNGAPWKYHNLNKINFWVFENLSIFSQKYQIDRFITSGHGSGVVFVGEDPGMNNDGSVLPMIDYEQSVPKEVNIEYAKIAGDFFDRGCAIMKSASHNAKQMFWAEKEFPEIFKNSKWALGISQYWAWRLSGVAVSEVTSLGGQSHLWNVINKKWSKIVKKQNWTRLLPPLSKTYSSLGNIRDKLARDFELPKNLIIHVGGHDSSINFYRYQSAGLKIFVSFQQELGL